MPIVTVNVHEQASEPHEIDAAVTEGHVWLRIGPVTFFPPAVGSVEDRLAYLHELLTEAREAVEDRLLDELHERAQAGAA